MLRHQNRDALNEAHMPFDFDELFLLFFFVAITLLLAFDAPYPSKQWRIANERRMNRLGRTEIKNANATTVRESAAR
jgi:hypothetical protein